MIHTIFKDRLFANNALLVLGLGLCPGLAASFSLAAALTMGIITLCVLVSSAMAVSLVRKIIDNRAATIASFVFVAIAVTFAQSLLRHIHPAMETQLGIYVPLIAVNCVIMSILLRHSVKNTMVQSAIESFAVGTGYTLALCIIAILREFLGTNRIAGQLVFPGFHPMSIFILAPGAFIVTALLMAAINLTHDNQKRGRQ